MKPNFLYESVAIAALICASAPASAEDINPFGGDIDPFSGDIDPFSGDIDPFGGDIDPFGGDINPFRGDIDPFSGDINPFYGDIGPFWGDIGPFWGDIDPFGGDIDPFGGDIDPFGGDIDSFWGDLETFNLNVEGIGGYWRDAGPMWGDINATWSALGSGAELDYDFEDLQVDLEGFVSFSAATWGAAVYAATGQSFYSGFATPLLAKYGIDLGDEESLENISATDRSRFFLEWYDGLMAFSGRDRIDHWMPLVNWSPLLTQDQGSGWDAMVGLLDVAISPDENSIEWLLPVGGYTNSINGHGAAVASLIAARHDGQGAMGIAPDAIVLSYSPFDDTGTASFADVSAGIDMLTGYGANVINMSLGVPGYTLHQDIADILQGPSAQAAAFNTVFVIASGNEGVAQPVDVKWDLAADASNLLIVGSVDPSKNISYFSNTPGEACLTVGGVCDEADKLKYRFLVAPGELILVSDNQGGTTRMSGTSFAAPIVTGAVSLLHDRWPWLQQYSEESVQLILATAQDLGAPGVDAIYGHGLLDIEASQSPLNFNNLEIYLSAGADGYFMLSSVELKSALLDPGQLDLWELSGAHLVAFEPIGDTERDFTIPLSTLLYGQGTSVTGNWERYQRHVYTRLVDWANGSGFAATDTYEAPVGSYGAFNISMLASPVSAFTPSSQADRPYDTAFLFKSKDQVLSLLVGQGAGALSLTSNDGFNSVSEHDPESGGVNPFLGFASGGSFAKIGAELAPGLELSLGFSNVEDDHSYVDETTGEDSFNDVLFSEYQATATFAEVTYALAKNVHLNASLTHLDEGAGVLGAQGLGVLSLDQGSQSNAATFGATVDLNAKFSLSGSITAGKTTSNQAAGSVLSIDNGGLTTSAFEFAAEASSLVKKGDSLMLTFAQPLHVESGALNYSSVQVIDRVTGELGVVDQSWGLGGGSRHFITEAQYGLPVLNGFGEVNLFGRVDIGGADSDGAFSAVAGGARFNLSF